MLQTVGSGGVLRGFAAVGGGARSVVDCVPGDQLRRIRLSARIGCGGRDRAAACVGRAAAVTRAAGLPRCRDRAGVPALAGGVNDRRRSEEHTSELQSLMRISYAVFCLKKKNEMI